MIENRLRRALSQRVLSVALHGVLGACMSGTSAAQVAAVGSSGAEWIVPSAAVDAVGGNREIAELSSLLQTWATRPDWPHLGPPKGASPFSVALDGDPTPAISSRLALFRTRFMIDAQECSGWSEFSASAARICDRLVAEYPAPAPGTSDIGEPWIAPAWIAVRALLLDVSGRHDEAHLLLFGDVERSWDGCCPADLSEDLFYLARARAEHLDRAGDARGALRWLHVAYFYCEYDKLADLFGRTRVASDLLMARYAILLTVAGEPDAAASVVRTLEARGRDSMGLAVERSALGERLSGVSKPAVTVFGIPLRDGTDGDYHGAGTAFVIGDPDVATTWKFVACSLPKFPDRKLKARIAPDCRTDLDVLDPSDARVIPFIQECVAQRAGWRWSQALLALQALDGSARQWLVPCLQELDVNDPGTYSPSISQAVDRAARLICGSGPVLTQPLETLPLSDLRDAWLTWLE